MRQKQRVLGIALLLAATLLGCGKGTDAATTQPTPTAAVSEAPDATTDPEVTPTSEITGEQEKTETETGELPEGVTVSEDGSLNYMANEAYMRPLGRTWMTVNARWLCFSGAGVEFEVTAKTASVTFTGDTTAKAGNEDSCARIAVYVDGERILDEMIVEKETTFMLFEESEAVTRIVKIVKLSECANSSVGIKAVTTDAEGVIVPTKQQEYLVEFIGDSITCGYGVDDEDRNHHFSTTTEDVTKAYAYKTAELLGLDYSMVSISGYGIISGYTTGDTPVSSQTMGQYYDRIGFSYGQLEGIIKPETIRWDFSTRQPDCIVINLGTNDASYCGSDDEKKQAYEDGYVEFLQLVRANNPDAAILCTLGIMGQDLYPQVENAVAAYIALTGDTNVSCMPFDVQLAQDGYAADWHPTETTHTKAAQKLAARLAEMLGVELPETTEPSEETAENEETEEIEGGEAMSTAVIDPEKPVIALTFDDGPNNETTIAMLDKLEEYGVVGSFFLVGNNITEATRATVVRTYEAGHEINSHSLTHSFMNEMTAEEITAEMEATAQKIYDIIGEYPNFFRPPYIAVNQTMLDTIDLPFISGFGANDWEPAVTAEERAEKVLAQARDGAIILLHDMYGNAATVAALDIIIPELQKQGYQFVTVSQLFETKGVTPARNIVYSYTGQTSMY